jgi:DNA-binding IclR family transcriptional regulator
VTATGKAALATLDDRELGRRLDGVAALPVFTANSIGSLDALRAEIAEVRVRGHAIDNEETVEGVVCLGIAIPGRRPGEGPYAASVTLLKARATDQRVRALVDDLHALTARLSDPMRAADRQPHLIDGGAPSR